MEELPAATNEAGIDLPAERDELETGAENEDGDEPLPPGWTRVEVVFCTSALRVSNVFFDTLTP